MDDFNGNDRTDAKARVSANIADRGDNLGALSKMQDDIRDSRTPLQAIQYCSEVKAMLADKNSQAHVSMTENERTGAVDVTLEIPALSADGRQYVDQMGRPMLVKEQVAHIETRQPDHFIMVPPHIDVAPPPCYEARPWLRLDEHRGSVRFDLNLGNGVRIDLGLGGHGPVFDRGREFRQHGIDMSYGDQRDHERRRN